MNTNKNIMDRINVTKETLKDGSESISYTKSWEKNGLSFRKEVRKVEGGYIILETKYGKPSDDETADYVDERKEYVSTENPFKKKEDSDEDEKMFDFIDNPLF